MANKYVIDLDLNGNEIQNFGIQTTASLPSSPFNGQVVNHNGTIKVYESSSTSWKTLEFDGHGHVISDVSGLQSALDAKVDDSQVLTNVPSGAVFTDTTYDAATNGGLSLSGTDFSVDSTVVRTSGAQTIAGNKTFSDDVVVNGDLTVSGAIVTKLSEQVEIEDNTILLNSNETGTPSEDAGIEVERGTGANVDLLWDEGTDRWTFTNDGTNYHNIPVTGEYSASTGTVTNVTGGTGISVSSGTTTPQVSLSHLGLQNLTDPNDDRIAFWDDSAGAFKWLDLGTNLSITGTTLNASDDDTTYTLGSSDGTNTADITLTPSAGGSQSVTLAGGSNVTINESSGTITIDAATGANYYAEAISFNTSTGLLYITMNGTTDISVDLDGRYLQQSPYNHYEQTTSGGGAYARIADSTMGIDVTSGVIVQVYEIDGGVQTQVDTDVKINTSTNEVEVYLPNTGLDYKIVVRGERQ